MKLSNAGKDLLKQFEGLRLQAYSLGDGKYTIGYGNTFYEDGTPVRVGDNITQQRAESLFNNIADSFAVSVSSLIKAPVTQKTFDAVVSYAYNRGIGSFRNSGVLRVINSGGSKSEIGERFIAEWGTNQKFKTALIERRKLEVAYFSSPEVLTADMGVIGGFVLAFVAYSIFKTTKKNA